MKKCRDGGVCHHYCVKGQCFREMHAGPLSDYTGAWGNDFYHKGRRRQWPRIKLGPTGHHEVTLTDALGRKVNLPITAVRIELNDSKSLTRLQLEIEGVEVDAKVAEMLCVPKSCVGEDDAQEDQSEAARPTGDEGSPGDGD